MKSDNKISKFLGGAWSEMKKITWTTREETIKYTITVLVVCVLVAAFLGGFDYLYMFLMQTFIF